MTALLLLTAGQASAQFRVVIDKKAIKIVGENTASAKAAEEVNKSELDSIKSKRATLFTKAAIRNLVKTAKMAQQTFLGDLRQEGAAYKQLVRECERFLNAAQSLTREAAKHPTRLIYCTKTVSILTLDATNTVHRCVKIAMGSKVKNPLRELKQKMEKETGQAGGKTFSDKSLFSRYGSMGKGYDVGGESGEEGNDGYNLIYPDERLMMVYETIAHLSKLSRTMEVLSFQLMTKWTWKDLLAQADPKAYYLAMGIVYQTQDIERELERLPFW